MLKRLVLASASPRRAQLLAQIGLDFLVVKSDYSEPEIYGEDDVQELALAKARQVSPGFPRNLVLGADTAVFRAGRTLGKPRDEQEALEMLRWLSGQVHSVVTGLALVQGKREITGVEKTYVHMRPFGEEEMKAYISTGEPFDKAGAYGIQGRGAVFVERIEGCYFNVVGLPLARLTAMLQKAGFSIWQK